MDPDLRERLLTLKIRSASVQERIELLREIMEKEKEAEEVNDGQTPGH